jgi:lysozyme
MYKGIDVSSIQSVVPWDWCVQQGISFVVIRCGIGSNQHDPNYTQNVAGAKAVGLKVMAYHVFYPIVGDIPEQIAAYHYSLAGGELASSDIEYPYPQDWVARGMTAAQVRDYCNRYQAKYSELDGRQMLIYSYPSFLKACAFTSADFTAQCKLWIASYTSSPAIPAPWTTDVVWQTAGGTALQLPGGVAVDTDVAADLSLWGPDPMVAPTPAPPPEVAPVPDPVAPDPIPAPVPPPVVNPPANGVVNFIVSIITGVFKNLFSR